MDDSSSLSAFTTSDSRTTMPKRYKNSIFAKFQQSKPKVANDEVLEYLKLDEIAWIEDLFTWWSHNEKHFHYLSILARKYLSVPATFTTSERMFSDVGNLMGSKRTKMDSELFKKNLFLKHNSEMLSSIHPSAI